MAELYVDVTAAGDESGIDWDNAADIDGFETWIEGTAVAGDTAFIRDGSYSTGGDIISSSRDGTAAAPITIQGVKAGTTNEGTSIVLSDLSRELSDFPFIDMGAFKFTTGDNYIIRGISWEGGGTHVLNVGAEGAVVDCKVYNDSVTSGRDGINSSTFGRVHNCDIEAENGHGIIMTGGNAIFNYIHDCTGSGFGAINLTANSISILFNIFDTCSEGLPAGSVDNIIFLNNTLYECDIAVDETNGDHWSAYNNIIEGSNTSGFDWTTQMNTNIFRKNWGDDTRNTDMWVNVDTTGIYQDYDVSTGDPLFTDPGNGDLSLQSGSGAIDDGYGNIFGVG